MLASKLKMVADKYNQSLQTKKETEIYNFLMAEMEREARAEDISIVTIIAGLIRLAALTL